jgi:integrase/recombinase XerC
VGTINSKVLLNQFEADLSDAALSPATIVNYLADLRAFLRWSEQEYGAGVSPYQLDSRDIQSFCLYLQKTRGHAPATVNRRLQTLRKFYGIAVAEGDTGSNPADAVSLLNEIASERSRFLTQADVDRLLAAVEEGGTRWVDRDRAIIQVFLGAGLKLTELTQLRLDDVHLDASKPYLQVRGDAAAPAIAGPGEADPSADSSRTQDELGADRTVPLQTSCTVALMRYQDTRRAAPGVEHVFVNRDGNPLSTRSVQRLLHRYAQKADLDGLTTQALRYVYAKRAYQSCGDLKSVARLLGHRHLATTIRYLRPVLEDMQSGQNEL